MSVEIEVRLEAIRKWIIEHKSFSELRDNNAYMHLVVDLGNHVRYLMVVASGMVATPSFPGYTKEQAVIVGLYVRLYKLYDALCFHVSENHGEISSIFIRLIFESYIRMEYIMTRGSDSARNFIFVSYRVVQEQIEDLQEKQRQRPLMPIENRILNKIRQQLKQDGIDENDLRRNKNWNLDGKSFRGLMGELGNDALYTYMFGAGSSMVHGDWKDLMANHLIKKEGFYFPYLDHDKVDPRYLCPISMWCLSATREFVEWNKSDLEGYVGKITSELEDFTRRIDAHHENHLMG